MDMMLCALEKRGASATGVVLAYRNGRLEVCKNDDRAFVFTNSKLYEEFLEKNLNDDVVCVLLHTRAPTGGASPRENKNNHPLYNGKTALIHNGVLSNHEFLFSDLKLKKEAETDSDIFRAILDKEGFSKKGFRTLSRVSGCAAIAAVSTSHPGKLLLAKSGNPVEMASTKDMLFFASEKGALHRAVRPWVNRFGLPFQIATTDMAFITMPSDSLYVFGEKGIEWHQEFKTAAWTSQAYNWREKDRVEADEQTTKAFLAERAQEDVQGYGTIGVGAYLYCVQCKAACRVDLKLMEVPIVKLRCQKCKSPFQATKETHRLMGQVAN